MADKRVVDAELQPECDLLVLDTIVYKTIASLLNAQKQSRDRKVVLTQDLLCELQMVETFLTIFRSVHQVSSIFLPSTIEFRLQLLRFVTLFTLRHEHTLTTPTASALTSLRYGNKDRADRWREREGRSAFPAGLYTAYRVDKHREPPIEAEQVQESDRQTLMDLIPSLIELTAARARVGAVIPTSNGIPETTSETSAKKTSNWSPTSLWLELVATMQLHAVLEYDSNHADTKTPPSLNPLLEAFAWGPSPHLRSPTAYRTTGIVPDSQDTCSHHDMLFVLNSETSSDDRDDISNPEDEGENEQDSAGTAWHTLRAHYLDVFVPPHAQQTDEATATTTETSAIHQHLQELRSRFPLVAFETQMGLFLEALHKGLEKPLLVQLEGAESATGSGGEKGEMAGLVVDGVVVGAEEERQWRRLVGWSGVV